MSSLPEERAKDITGQQVCVSDPEELGTSDLQLPWETPTFTRTTLIAKLGYNYKYTNVLPTDCIVTLFFYSVFEHFRSPTLEGETYLHKNHCNRKLKLYTNVLLAEMIVE